MRYFYDVKGLLILTIIIYYAFFVLLPEITSLTSADFSTSRAIGVSFIVAAWVSMRGWRW
ncbi:hypothetical protein SAMN04488696_2012 [Methanolobus profundi]|uniref:Uncharacterized protein n=1 Tax=Methanolobus profundi TaxID=487685 RepID=A0A1I4SUE9_9EURY|nr:hypothetical protein SAMN04488696_2012 [Methanolobus profundi]